MRWRPVYPVLALAFVLLALLRGLAAPVAATGVRVSSGLPGLQTGPAPWGRNVAQLRARLEALGLPALAQEGTVLHIHQHLDVFVNGRRVTVPAGIGIDAAELFISPLHTHDTSGVIHVESPVVREFTLGQFFGVWGVRFTPRCVGGDCASHRKKLRVYVDGRPAKSDPRLIPLTAHEEIAVVFGARPRQIPRSYAFAPGL